MTVDGGEVRRLDKASIRAFVEKHRGLLTGKVLDFGAGLQPYRDLVSGEYVPFNIDHPSTPSGSVVNGTDEAMSADYDAILCNQVLQYVRNVPAKLELFWDMLADRHGHLVMTYATSWAEVETTDLWRFTRAGMETLLLSAGFEIVDHELRASLDFPGWNLPIGYGVVARA